MIKLNPKADVVISRCVTSPGSINIDFTRPLGIDGIPYANVITDLSEVNGFSVYKKSMGILHDFIVFVHPAYDANEVADAIADELTDIHQLKVLRLISNPETEDQTPSLPASRFVLNLHS